MAKNLVIIPTFNEIENIEAIIHDVLSLDVAFDILIVDDGSPDGTATKVKELQITYPQRIHLIERTGKQGLGTAYIVGFKWGLEHGYVHLCEMDADFSHPPQKLVNLIQAVEDGADIAVGSRYTKGGKVENWPMDRLFLSYGASLYVRLITGMMVKDPTAGFVCYKNTVLEALNLDQIEFVGYAFQIEMKYKSHKKGFKIVEVPITFRDREKGSSKMNGSIIKEAVWGVLKLRFSKN